MSGFLDSDIGVSVVRFRGLTQAQFAALATALAVLGVSAIAFTIRTLWTLWETDPLKSIGMVIPLVSLVLVLRVWRSLGWESDGTWWGLLILLIAMVVAQIQEHANLVLVISPNWSTVLPQPSVMLLAYGSGVVLLLGGARLYRAALFPIILLLFANPVPHIFSVLVDLPLQEASAQIARAFAMDLGHPLTPDHLRLMFTPTFGMFIAPGCNGIRGSVTMGFIALVAGYFYRFRWIASALVVVGGIVLGYLFNLARLCFLVLYYIVALHLPSLQNKAEMADYVIGAALFLVATFLLFTVIHRFRNTGESDALDAAKSPHRDEAPEPSQTRYGRLAAMLGIVLAGGLGVARSASAVPLTAMTAAEEAAARFPQTSGTYTLVRSWTETAPVGPIIYVWAQYVSRNGGAPISLGVSPVLGSDNPLICHLIRGERPAWQGPLTMTTFGAAPIKFSSALYDDGVTRSLEATTLCTSGICGEFANQPTHFGFVYVRPDPKYLFNPDPQRPIPVVVRAETNDMTLPAEAARQQLTQELQAFLASVQLDDLTQPYSR